MKRCISCLLIWTVVTCRPPPTSAISDQPAVARDVSQSSGAGTTLTVTVMAPAEYDGSSGQSRVDLHHTVDDAVLFTTILNGQWRAIGYNPNRGQYLLLGAFQMGAWLPHNRITYLDANTGHLSESRINPRGWLAFVAIPNAAGRFVALIGQPDGQTDDDDFSLMLLDTSRDELRRLGHPPAPPPLDASEIRGAPPKGSPEAQWRWPAAFDGAMDLDEGILFFRDGQLCATYGADTAVRRAEDRFEKCWNLERPI